MIRGSMTISYVDGSTSRDVATLVDANVSIRTATIGAAPEDDYGFSDALPAEQSWGASGSYLQKIASSTRDASQARLEVLALARTLLAVTLTTPYGESYFGSGYIERFDVQAALGDVMRGSFALRGIGPLAKTPTGPYLHMEADSLAGTTDGATIGVSAWEDQSLNDFNTTTQSGVYRATDGPNGRPCVELLDGTGMGAGFVGNTIAAGTAYATLFVFRVMATPSHLDVVIDHGLESRDTVHWFNFGGQSMWRFYNGSAPGSDTLSGDIDFFDNWGLLKIHNTRDSSGIVSYDGTVLHTAAADAFNSNEVTALGTGGYVSIRVAAVIMLDAPSAAEIAEWEGYLNSKYAL